MTKSEMNRELLVFGAVARLSELNKERDYLLRIINKDRSTDKAERVIAASRKMKKKQKGRKWSPQQRAKFLKTMKGKYNK